MKLIGFFQGVSTYSTDELSTLYHFPDINYNKHYINSIEQLSLLMKKARKSLHKIRKPILIIQGQDDSVVNPSSAHEIYEKIESRYKSLKIIEASKHVIITGENTDELFTYILNFILQGKS